MTPDKEPLHNCGLINLIFLDGGLYRSSSLIRIINPRESSGFNVVTLFDHGVDSTLRAGLNLNEQNLFYFCLILSI
jgi:hypothetical protein